MKCDWRIEQYFDRHGFEKFSVQKRMTIFGFTYWWKIESVRSSHETAWVFIQERIKSDSLERERKKRAGKTLSYTYVQSGEFIDETCWRQESDTEL